MAEKDFIRIQFPVGQEPAVLTSVSEQCSDGKCGVCPASSTGTNIQDSLFVVSTHVIENQNDAETKQNQSRKDQSLRRTYARDSRRAGNSESAIMAQCGWKTTAIFRRYAIVASADLQSAAETVRSVP